MLQALLGHGKYQDTDEGRENLAKDAQTPIAGPDQARRSSTTPTSTLAAAPTARRTSSTFNRLSPCI